MVKFDESTMLLNITASDGYEVINLLAEKLYDQGYVTSDYGDRTCQREEIHPTGLPTKPFCIAFPHADSDGVIESALAVGILTEPVAFKNMAEPDEDLSVSIVIMLANADPSEQIQTLRSLATLFGQGDKLVELKAQKTPQSAVAWLRQELNLG